MESEVETILSSILVSEKNGLLLHQLEDEYQSIIGTGIPYEKLGFSSLIGYLNSSPGVVICRDRNGEFVAHAASCDAMSHVQDLVAQQKPSKGGPMRPGRNWSTKPHRLTAKPYQARQQSGVGNGYYQISNNVAQPYQTRFNPQPLRNKNFEFEPRYKTPRLRDQPAPRRQQQQSDRDTSVSSWETFLVDADIPPYVARRYAAILSRRGLSPKYAWQLPFEDFYAMGIENGQDVAQILQHALKVRPALEVVTRANQKRCPSPGPVKIVCQSQTNCPSSPRLVLERGATLSITVRNDKCPIDAFEWEVLDSLSFHGESSGNSCVQSDDRDGENRGPPLPPVKSALVQQSSRGFKVVPLKAPAQGPSFKAGRTSLSIKQRLG